MPTIAGSIQSFDLPVTNRYRRSYADFLPPLNLPITTRVPAAMTPVPVLTIGDVDYTLFIDMASINKQENLNEQPDTITFRIHGYQPTFGQIVKLGLGSVDDVNLQFAGTITDVKQVYDAAPLTINNIAWEVSCTDFTLLLNRRKPIGIFTNWPAASVINYIVSNFSLGFTVAIFNGPMPTITISLTGDDSFAECMTNICNLAGFHWDVSYTRVVMAYTTRPGTPPATVDINNTTMQVEPRFTYELNGDQLRTRVKGKGPTTVTALDVAIGATVIPVAATGIFNAAGGQAFAARNPGEIQVDVLTYTGLVAGGITTAVTTGDSAGAPAISAAQPSPQVTGRMPYTSGGTVQYKVSVVTATGEGVAGSAGSSSVGGVSTSGGSNAVAATTAGAGMTAGNYGYSWTMVTALGESNAIASTTITLGGGQNSATITGPTYSDARILRINIYRTKVGGATKFLVGSLNSTGSTWVDTTADIALNGSVLPTVDNCQGGAITVTVGVAPDSRVTSRNLYRTLSGGSTFFLLARLDNTSTTYVDILPDSALGAVLPTTSTISFPIGKSTLGVSDLAQVPASGFVTVGGQTISYAGRSAGTGSGTLTGIPTSGVGSIVQAIPVGSVITVTATLTGVTGVLNAIASGSTIGSYAIVDDVAAQLVVAAAEGGDGIIEYPFTDTDASGAQLILAAQAYINLFKSLLVTINGGARDVNIKAGSVLTVNLPAPMSISVSVQIQSVSVTNWGSEQGAYPLFTPNASSVKYTFLDWMRELGGLLPTSG